MATPYGLAQVARVVGGTVKVPVWRSQQDGDGISAIIRDRQIWMAVAIHIANRNLVGLLADGVGGGVAESAILVIQQYADSAGRLR